MQRSSVRVLRAFNLLNFPLLACFSFLCFFSTGIVIGIQTMFSLQVLFHPFFIWVYSVLLIVVGMPIVWVLLGALWRVAVQKYVFEEELFRFRNDDGEQEIRYNHVVKVRLHITSGGFHNPPGRLLAFQCRNRQPNIVWHDTFAFSYRTTLKVLVELAIRAGLGCIEISKSNLVEGELRRAAKGLGKVEFDKDKGCYWFKPFKN